MDHGVGSGNYRDIVLFLATAGVIVPLFKRLRVVRFLDQKRNTLVYLAYSDKLIDGSPKNSVSSVPIMPWPGQQPGK